MKKIFLTLDMETYFATKYELKGLGTSQFVSDPRFSMHSVAIKTLDSPRAYSFGGPEAVADVMAKLRANQHRIVLCGHNLYFDAYIAYYHYNFIPAYMVDTLCMAQVLHAHDGPLDLDFIAQQHYGREGKIQGVLDYWKNLHWADATEAQRNELLHYNARDVEETEGIALEMIKQFPRFELDIIDLTLRMFTDPRLRVDAELAQEILVEERARKEETAAGVEASETQLRSIKQFAALLEERGYEVPEKWSEKQEKFIPALAKDDLPYQRMQNSDDPDLRALIEARVTCNSAITETRARGLLARADRKLPIGLMYGGAHTMRWCMPGETEVLTPEGWVRLDSWAGQPIAQWEPKSKKTTWCHQPEVNAFDYEGDLITLHSMHVQGAFTPEHRVARYTTKGAFKSDPIRTVEGKNLRHAVPTEIAGGKKIPEDLVRFIVAASADGYYGNAGTLQFSFRKERKIDRLRSVLLSLSIEYSAYLSGKEYRFYIPRRELPMPREQLKCPNVHDVMSWSLDCRRVFIDELRYWDGNSNRKQLYVTSTDYEFIELITAVGASVGLTSSVYRKDKSANPKWSDLYEVGFRKHSYVGTVASSWGTKQHKGYVYCPTTDTGFFVARYDNKIHVTGNSGTDKINPQNLPRNGRLRHCLMADKGHVLVIVDAAQIEARDNATFAEQWDLVEEFARGEDVYASFASELYGAEVTKATHPEERFVGKTSILGLGYQMGAAKFQLTLEQGMMGPPLKISFEEAQRAVNLYRSKYYMIKQHWYELQCLIPQMLGNGHEVEHRGIVIKPGGEVLMPNGLHLYYPGLTYSMHPEYNTPEYEYWPYDKQYKTRVAKKLYGGLFDENLVQCRARIMTAEHMLRLSRFYRVVLMAHDEIVFHVPVSHADRCLSDALEVMSEPPQWNDMCPLAAEGKISDHYIKD